ncbi:MAG: serine/threonine protein kinase [Labilithrix sp.]|nr:serine/threonine protein kinase [Labilithrix sp.]MCW5817203.1 serine/threonine protein kinase [Labilithrix sp.]
MAAEDLPVLIASLSKDEARQLEEAARVGRDVRLNLKWSPIEAGPHLLEVYLPTSPMPLNFLAEPLEVGDGEEGVVPLRVYPWEEEEESAPVAASMPEVEVPEVPQDRFVGRPFARGRFEIISPLGEGSIGAVYRARHTGLGIIVALKVLHEAFQHDAEFGRRFHAEALALSQLDHPNLIHIQDFGEDPDEQLLYISMAFVEGETLRGIQKKENKIFALPRIVNLMAQACAGLGHAHERGLIHRDVKPDNMMVLTREDDDGNKTEVVKVLDFGFAVTGKVSGEVAQRLAGTPVYMSPEQCLGHELDGRSDVYACGIMLFEMATGTVPFLARDAETIRRMHIKTPAPAVSQYRTDIDPRYDRIVAKALAKRREDRFASMSELRAELRQLLVKEAPRVPAPAPPPLPRAAPPPPVPAPPPRPVRAAARELPSWAREVANAPDFATLAHRLVDLGGHIRPLAQEADVLALHAIAKLLDSVADRAHIDDDSRAAHNAVASIFTEPAVLAPIAARLLAWDEEGREAAADLIVRGGAAGVYALYGARTRVADANARIAFVTTMKACGDIALPVVRAALEKVMPRAVGGEHRAGVELAEDLLLSVPPLLDDATGRLVEQYASSPVPTLCRAAARALPRVWADRAGPTLLKLLDMGDESVLTAAIAGLRESNQVDARAVRKLGALADRGKLKSPQLKAVAVAALGAAMPSAKPDAAQVLESLR